ncbi:MAG TPA: type 1 glutamine amidotransferase [Nitrososphaeraceae archaeon]|nr:type 1 glutamine amidotransferase [Nitrososphaeraceae archaeon]
MSKNILVIQNIGCEHLGNLSRLFESDGYNVLLLNSQKDLIPTDLISYSGIIILGGPVSVYDNYDYLKDQQKLIKKAVDMKIPTLGVCLGSQLIAEAMGGKVYPGNLKEIGWHDIEITENGSRDIFNGIATFNNKVFQWHGDTFQLPESAIILAKSDTYIQAFRINTAIGIQFHIEVNESMIEEWIRIYSKEIMDLKLDEKNIIPQQKEQIINLHILCKLVYNNFKKMIYDYNHKYNQQY